MDEVIRSINTKVAKSLGYSDEQEIPDFASDLNAIIPVCKQLKGFVLAWDDWDGGQWEATCEKPSNYEYGEWWSAQGSDPAVVCCELWLMVKGESNGSIS